MGVQTKVTKKAHVEIQRAPDNAENEVGFYIVSDDGSPLTGNQIIEAVAEAVLLYWDNCPIEPRNGQELDS